MSAWATPAKQLPPLPACRLCKGSGRTVRSRIDLHGREETAITRCRCTDLDRCDPCECGTCDDPYADLPSCYSTFRCLGCRERWGAAFGVAYGESTGYCDDCAPTVGGKL